MINCLFNVVLSTFLEFERDRQTQLVSFHDDLSVTVWKQGDRQAGECVRSAGPAKTAPNAWYTSFCLLPNIKGMGLPTPNNFFLALWSRIGVSLEIYGESLWDSVKIRRISGNIAPLNFSAVLHWLKFSEFSPNLSDFHWFKFRVMDDELSINSFNELRKAVRR